MPRKTIVRLSVKSAFTPEAPFRELQHLTRECFHRNLIQKRDTGTPLDYKDHRNTRAGRSSTPRALHLPVRTTEAYYIIGTEDIPAQPTHKEEHLVVITIEYKSRTKPTAHKKVLSIAPACE